MCLEGPRPLSTFLDSCIRFADYVCRLLLLEELDQNCRAPTGRC
jgi:hypothetical protein